MAWTNTPIKQLQDYTFDEIGSFGVDQLSGVAMDQQFTPYTNTSKVSFAVTWDTWNVAWQNETRTWDELGSLLSNTSFRNLGSYTVAELASFTPEQLAEVSFDRQFTPWINTSKT